MCPVYAVYQAPPPLQPVPPTAGSIGTPALAHGEPSALCQQILEFWTVCMDANLRKPGKQLACNRKSIAPTVMHRLGVSWEMYEAQCVPAVQFMLCCIFTIRMTTP